jgi:hypothetical protein
MVGYADFHGPPGVDDTLTAGAAEVDWAYRRHGVAHFISGAARR